MQLSIAGDDDLSLLALRAARIQDLLALQVPGGAHGGRQRVGREYN